MRFPEHTRVRDSITRTSGTLRSTRRNVLEFIGYPQKSATVIYQDNKSAILWSEEGTFSGNAKHIDVKYHYTAEQIRVVNVTVEYVSTKDMIADCMKNILPDPELKRLRELIRLIQLKEEKKADSKKEF